jgi:hypothetical protein
VRGKAELLKEFQNWCPLIVFQEVLCFKNCALELIFPCMMSGHPSFRVGVHGFVQHLACHSGIGILHRPLGTHRIIEEYQSRILKV